MIKIFIIFISGILLFTNCTLPPIALNHNIPVENMAPKSSEFGIPLGLYQGKSEDEISIGFLYLPFWWRQNITNFLDIGGRIYFILPTFPYYTKEELAFFISFGPELIIGKKPIKIVSGIYIPSLWSNSPLDWQVNLLFGNDEFYGGIRFSNWAQGFVVGVNFYTKNNQNFRGEFSYLLPPLWKKKEISGSAITFSFAIVKKKY